MPAPIATPPPPFIFEFLKNVGSPVAIATLLYSWVKDQTRDVKSRQILETARNRMAFWDSRFKLQSLALQGAELEQAKQEALKAADEIKQHADTQLGLITWRPTRRTDLPRWKRYTLLYRPSMTSKRERVASYFARAGYWLMSLTFWAFVILIPTRTAWLYFGEAPEHRGADIADLMAHKQVLYQLGISLSMLFGVLIFNGLIFYFSARNEGERPKVEPLELKRV